LRSWPPPRKRHVATLLRSLGRLRSRRRLSDDDRVVFGARIAGGLARTGIFVFDANSNNEKVVTSNDDPPTDDFGPNSSYLKINPGNRKSNEGIGVDHSGTRIAYTAKVKDTLGTPTASGVFLCTGS